MNIYTKAKANIPYMRLRHANAITNEKAYKYTVVLPWVRNANVNAANVYQFWYRLVWMRNRVTQGLWCLVTNQEQKRNLQFAFAYHIPRIRNLSLRFHIFSTQNANAKSRSTQMMFPYNLSGCKCECGCGKWINLMTVRIWTQRPENDQECWCFFGHLEKDRHTAFAFAFCVFGILA